MWRCWTSQIDKGANDIYIEMVLPTIQLQINELRSHRGRAEANRLQ
jgi:hypothetical protein